MQPRKTLQLLASAGLALSLAVGATAADPKKDHFKLSYSVHIDGSGPTRVWLPVAHDDVFQKVEAKIPTYLSKHSGANGNEFAFAKVYAPADITLHYDVTRIEEGALRSCATDAEKWLGSDKLIPVNAETRKVAQTVTKALSVDASNTQKARAIYDHVVSSMKYDKSGQGWGRGDFVYACNVLKGNCTDFHSLFIGLCRAVNVPARFTMGLSVPQGEKGKVEGYHCWAEFYDPAQGWTPVDASVATQTGKREFYFGKLDPHRVAFTLGRDIELQPRQSGVPLNYMIFAYAERNGALVSAKTTITFER